jgi:hypothetical protein
MACEARQGRHTDRSRGGSRARTCRRGRTRRLSLAVAPASPPSPFVCPPRISSLSTSALRLGARSAADRHRSAVAPGRSLPSSPLPVLPAADGVLTSPRLAPADQPERERDRPGHRARKQRQVRTATRMNTLTEQARERLSALEGHSCAVHRSITRPKCRSLVASSTRENTSWMTSIERFKFPILSVIRASLDIVLLSSRWPSAMPRVF